MVECLRSAQNRGKEAEKCPQRKDKHRDTNSCFQSLSRVLKLQWPSNECQEAGNSTSFCDYSSWNGLVLLDAAVTGTKAKDLRQDFITSS